MSIVISNIQDRINSAFSDLVFEEERHLYFLRGQNLTSVSKKVENHAPKFDAENILPFSAIKASRLEQREVTVHELRHKWQTINKSACDLGHETHNFMERYSGIEMPTTPQQKAGVKFFHDMSKEYIVIFRENRMYSSKYSYAGTEDLLLIHRQTGDTAVGDYKTNGDLFKNYKGQTLLAPFDSLLNHPYNKYQLQLSYYQIMLEEIGITVSDRLLIYLKADETYSTFHLLDFTSELKNIMDNQQKRVA